MAWFHLGLRSLDVGPVSTFFDRSCGMWLVWLSGSGEAANPDPVTPEYVIQRAIDRAKEAAPLYLYSTFLQGLDRTM
tara:strand:+ start:166 stop:396 length:231 start_codon:yes stop_codon:yes gene_type:complete